MVIVPHEDDEILMAAGIIERALQEKKQVTVVMATNGDYEGRDKVSGSVRLKETLMGLEVLGLSQERVIFMGYADTGMDPEESFLYNLYTEKEENKLHPGHCSAETYGLPKKADFHTERYGSPAAYTRRNFKEDLRRIIRENEPDTIFTTSEEDMHGDHSGLFFFVKEILREEKERGYAPVLYSTVVHTKSGDENWPKRLKKGDTDDGVGEAKKGRPLSKLEAYTCPPGFNEGSLDWEKRVRFPVSASMQSGDFSVNLKALALSMHKNALKEDAVEYLYAFIKAEEIFWKIEY